MIKELYYRMLEYSKNDGNILCIVKFRFNNVKNVASPVGLLSSSILDMENSHPELDIKYIKMNEKTVHSSSVLIFRCDRITANTILRIICLYKIDRLKIKTYRKEDKNKWVTQV